MRLIAFGDIHMQPARCRDIPGLPEADKVLITGDLTNFGGRTEASEILAKIAKINPNLLAVAGNLDRPEVEELLAEKGFSLHGRGLSIGTVGLFGVGGSNPTPFHTPNEFSEKEMEQLLQAGHALVRDSRFRILVCHTPPYQSATDRIATGIHAGSPAVRTFIEQEQPDLCLCGHIHEARGTDRIGRTRILNAGMLQEGGWIDVTVSNDKLSAVLNTQISSPTNSQCQNHTK